MRDLEIIQLIKTNLLTMGRGTEDSPIRRITQYWDMDGNLLWQIDPLIKYGFKGKDICPYCQKKIKPGDVLVNENTARVHKDCWEK